MVRQKAVPGQRTKPPSGGCAITADLQSLLGVDVDLVMKGVLTNPYLQSEQALLHARAITEWIREALASRR